MTVDIGFACCKCGQGFGYINRIPIILEIRDCVMARVHNKLIRPIPPDHIIVARATIQNIVISYSVQGIIPLLSIQTIIAVSAIQTIVVVSTPQAILTRSTIYRVQTITTKETVSSIVPTMETMDLERNVVRGRDKFGNHFFNASFVEGDF